MERFDTSQLDKIAFKAINQNGRGYDIDRYIYSQSGEGLGSFFGKVVKTAIPLLTKAIKGTAKAAAPHLTKAAVTAGSNILEEGLENISKKGIKKQLKEAAVSAGSDLIQEGLDNIGNKRKGKGVVKINHKRHKLGL